MTAGEPAGFELGTQVATAHVGSQLEELLRGLCLITRGLRFEVTV